MEYYDYIAGTDILSPCLLLFASGEIRKVREFWRTEYSLSECAQMCGIAGIVVHRGLSPEAQAHFHTMVSSIAHRGPDDKGYWSDQRAGLILGHRRLSILDLSPEGHQPMMSQSGRYVMVYNGEIYNYQELSQELTGKYGYIFRGHSDTEVMLAAFEQWGIIESVQRMNGMFTIALWDKQDQKLHLIRDRLGKKPLYYGWINDAFVFASELKAFRAWPSFSSQVDRDVLALFLRHNYIPGPYSIYRGIYKLPPGCHISLTQNDFLQQGDFSPFPGNERSSKRPSYYWNAKEIAENGLKNPFTGDTSSAIETLEKLLLDAVRIRMISDVPLGAFLSGGIDSSTIVALMQAQSTRPVQTFSIGFFEDAYNEASHAKAVAAHLGTNHTELYVTAEEAQAVIPLLPSMYDEPFSDVSQIPTYLVSRLARTQVTVSLSGDGGDELCAGYNRYAWASRVWGAIGWLPHPLRQTLAHLLEKPSPQTWNAVFSWLGPLLRVSLPGDKIHKLAEILRLHTANELYHRLVSHWANSTDLVLGAHELQTPITNPNAWISTSDFRNQMMYLDLVTYLPDDILVKVDRAGMAVSLEGRVPLLDYRVVEYLWTIPLSMKIHRGTTKWLLRQVLHKYVPESLVTRPKMGFGVPIDSWLRGPLRAWAEELLDERRLRSEGYFNPQPIRAKWKEHLEGKRNWQYYIWDILMFQAWQHSNAQSVTQLQAPQEEMQAVASY